MCKSISSIEIYEKAPIGFAPLVEVSACYIEIDNKLLLLQRSLRNLEPGNGAFQLES